LALSEISEIAVLNRNNFNKGRSVQDVIFQLGEGWIVFLGDYLKVINSDFENLYC